MSLKIDRVELEIVIKNDENRKQLRQIEDDMRRVRKELKKLPEGTQEWVNKKTELSQLQASYDAIYDKIGLTGLSLKELRKRQQDLNAVIKQLPGNSPLLSKYQKQVSDVTTRIRQLNGQASSTGLSLSKMANGVNKYFALFTAALASVTGISMAFRKIATDVAHLDDVYSDVMKTTGLTRAAVVDLNEDFKRMDTRTSRESLNNLARDAGKLGLEGKKNILDFVEAGNQINVALGEDLGDDAIKNIGKMVGVYQDATKELQGIDLKGQMLAVGSAINEIGANSSASEQFLVDFAARVGGISRQAGIAMDDVLGFGSALDQDMQQVEMSSTAFTNFIQKLMGNPAKFAKLAGLEVKGFTKLLSTDANAAIKQVLRALSEKGGFQALIPIFQEMGLDGSRAVGVLSSMAASIDKIDTAQKLANDSMNAGVSVTNEYNIKNNNLAAKLDKAKKAFFEVSLLLGEKLNPVLLKSTNLVTALIRGLVKLIPYFPAIGKVLLVLTGYFIAYNGQQILGNILLKEGLGLQAKQIFLRLKDVIVLEALIIKEAIHGALIGKTTLATKAAAIAQTLWNIAMKANPLGWAIGLLTTLTALYFLLGKKIGSVSELQKSQLSISKSVSDQYNEQSAKVDALVSILNNEKLALEERKKALNELKSLVPGYHADLTDEGVLINNNTEAIKKYLLQMEREVRFKATKDELELLFKQKRQLEKELETSIGVITLLKDVDTQKAVQKKTDGIRKSLSETALAISALTTEMENTTPKVNTKTDIAIGSKKIGDDGQTYKWDGKAWILVKTASGGGDGDGKDPHAERVKKLEKEQLSKQVALKKEQKSKEDFDAGMIELEETFLTKKRDLYKSGSDQWNEYENKLLDLQRSRTATANDIMLKAIQDANASAISSIDVYEQQKREMLQDRLDTDLSFQGEYTRQSLALDITLAEKRLQQAEDYAVLISDAKYNSEEEKKKAVDAAQAAVTAEKNTLTKARKAITKNKLQEEKEYQDKVAQMRNELGLNKEKLSYAEGLNALKNKLKIAEASEKESADAILDYKLGKVEQYASAAAQLAQSVSESISGFQDAELTTVQTKYDKMIDAAQAAGEDTTELEEKKESEQAKIRAKYADANFVVTIAQITASTAAAAINAYKAMMELGPIGLVLGPIAAAAAVVYGGSQIKQAKTARDAAKAGFRSGGFTSSDPDDDKESGVVHANEFVNNADSVRNPSVRKFLDVFDVAQKNGTIRMLNTTQILEKVRFTGGSRRSGGYGSSVPSTSTSNSDSETSRTVDMMTDLMEKHSYMYQKLIERLSEPLQAESVISGSSGSYKKTKDYERLLANKSRG